MNKYSVRIPYSYLQYGYLSGFIYAEDEDEAYELARDNCNLEDSEYEDSDGESTQYEYNEMEIELEEEDIDEIPDSVLNQDRLNGKNDLPSYFLSEINSL
jgi:hypothetical protein